MAVHGPPDLSKIIAGARKIEVPTTMPTMMLTASHKPRRRESTHRQWLFLYP